MDNNLRDKLSMDAIALLYIMLSYGEDYFDSLKDVQNKTEWKKEKWERIILELKEGGFVNVHKRQKENGKWNYTLVVDYLGTLEPQFKGKRKKSVKEKEEIKPFELNLQTNMIIYEEKEV